MVSSTIHIRSKRVNLFFQKEKEKKESFDSKISAQLKRKKKTGNKVIGERDARPQLVSRNHLFIRNHENTTTSHGRGVNFTKLSRQ